MGSKCSKQDDSVIQGSLDSGKIRVTNNDRTKIRWLKKLSSRKTNSNNSGVLDETSLDFTHHKTAKSLVSLLSPPMIEENVPEKENDVDKDKQKNDFVNNQLPRMRPSSTEINSHRAEANADFRVMHSSLPSIKTTDENKDDKIYVNENIHYQCDKTVLIRENINSSDECTCTYDKINNSNQKGIKIIPLSTTNEKEDEIDINSCPISPVSKQVSGQSVIKDAGYQGSDNYGTADLENQDSDSDKNSFGTTDSMFGTHSLMIERDEDDLLSREENIRALR